MKRFCGSRKNRTAVTVATVLAASLCGSIALAQPPGGPGGPGGPPPGGGPGGPGGPGRPMMGPLNLTALDIPAPALQQALSLTDDQTTKIAAIQKKNPAQRGPG